MNTFELTQIDKPHHGDKWQFQIDGSAARLLNSDGRMVATFTPDQAFEQVEIVRFAKSGHNIGITVDGQKRHFTAWPKAFKGIKAFTELSPLAADTTTLESLRRSGLIRLIVGGLLFFGGGILSLDGLLKLGGFGGGGESYLFYGAIVFGAAFLYQSHHYYSEARRLAKIHS